MIRVYIAAPFELQSDAQYLARLLSMRPQPIGCTARWLTAGGTNDQAWADRCVADVVRCDVLVALNPADWKRSGTGGRHVEYGIAVALRKPLVIVGQRSNLFHHVAGVELVEVGPECTQIVQAYGARIAEAIVVAARRATE
jgi:nucleoside 2-deoxyribosyltransferase